MTVCSDHKPVQHRDGKPPWCNKCGLTAHYTAPKSRFEKKIEEPPPSNEWMQTFTGKAFFPFTCQPEDINIFDIAHSLAMQCRYNGHTERFYSVAEHCVLMSQWVPEKDALWALLHDATEAYVGDMVRPIKKHMPDYIRIEKAIMSMICIKFDLPFTMPESVYEADNRIIENERAALLKSPPLPWTVHGSPLPDIEIHGWDPTVAEYQYYNRFVELMDARAGGK